MHHHRFEVLDSFRGLCALFVVVHHMHWQGSFTDWAFFRGSDLFVEFFFVLSGFVLAHGYAYKENLAFRPIVQARIFRLFPLHLFMLGLFVCMEGGKWLAHKTVGFSFNNAPFTQGYALGELLPNLVLIQAWTPWTNALSFNTPAWSISIEFYMYLLLYLTLSAQPRVRHWIWLSIPLAMAILTLTETKLLLSLVMRGLTGFFGGAFCYHLFRNYAHRLPLGRGLATVLEFFSVVGVYGIITTPMPYHTLWATLWFFLTVLVFAKQSGKLSHLLGGSLFQQGGQLSYSLYLTHGAVIYVATSLGMILQKLTGLELMPMVDGNRVFDSGNALLNTLGALLTIIAVIGLSRWTYQHIELPGQRLGRRLRTAQTIQPGFSSAISGRSHPQSSSAARRPTSGPA